MINITYKYLVVVLFLLGFKTYAVVPQIERDALVDLYNSTNGDNWIQNNNWLIGDPCDNNWFAVICNGNKVTGIDLSENQLTGTIPVSIGNMLNLRFLLLNRNQINGRIPVEIGNLTKLNDLFLNQNNLTGPIPLEIGNLINLTSLILHINELESSLPSELGNLTRLIDLRLNGNQFNGSVPVEFNSLNSLQRIDVNFNALTSNLSALDLNNFIATQTLVPLNFQSVAISDKSVSFNWEIVDYQVNYGGYEISMSNNLNGSYIPIYQNTSKNISAASIGGLNANQTYFFKIRSYTNQHANNESTLFSTFSPTIMITTNELGDSTDLAQEIDGIIPTIPPGGMLNYSFVIFNFGSIDAMNSGFIQNFPVGLINGSWVCNEDTGTAICPIVRGGIGNLNMSVDLPANSSLIFSFTSEVLTIDEGSLLITSTLTPPDGVNDEDLGNNETNINLEIIFKNDFDNL